MSHKLVAAFLEGYQRGAQAEVQTIDLAARSIRPCTGCYSCWKSGSGRCVQKDDMEAILPAYAEADLVLVSTPVYHFGMTAILKAFFERSLPLLYPYLVKKGELYTHPERMAVNPKQEFGLFATCGFPDADNFRVLSAHFEKLLGPRLRFQFLCPEGELLGVPQMREAAAPRLEALKKAGEALARTGAMPPGAEAAVAAPMVDLPTFARLANANWAVPGELPPSEAALAGLEPYRPTDHALAEARRDAKDAMGPSPARSFLEQMRAMFNAEAAAGLEADLQFDFTDLGESYRMRIAKGSCELESGGAGQVTTRIIVPFSTWKAISEGELGGEEALMKGAYRVEGDFGLMMKMGSLFGGRGRENAGAPSGKKRRPNLMALAFVPWYLAWFLGGASFWLGQALPLAISLAFLAWRESRREATWFERGTPIAFAFLAALALASPRGFGALWSGLANAAIALIWGTSLLYSRPLTSDYSAADYSEAVASGPIFRRVNFGLTALWAALFALSAVAGLFLAGLGQGRIAIATALALIPAGVFTAWFPRWYPGHLARKGGRCSPSVA
jgi:putative sterol carrier protein/putative NADPH-quinone reductase